MLLIGGKSARTSVAPSEARDYGFSRDFRGGEEDWGFLFLSIRWIASKGGGRFFQEACYDSGSREVSVCPNTFQNFQKDWNNIIRELRGWRNDDDDDDGWIGRATWQAGLEK